MRSSSQKGFTLIELLVVVAIIGLLASVILASLSVAEGKARNSQRISEMGQIQQALELYYNNHGTYPASDGLGCGTWESSGADESSGNSFIKALVTDGDLPAGGIKDPTPSLEGSCGNLMYFYYPAGYAGCPKSFYVLGIVTTDQYGTGVYPTSPGWSCPSENWQTGYSWVTGNFAPR